jgi:hypothetical protein
VRDGSGKRHRYLTNALNTSAEFEHVVVTHVSALEEHRALVGIVEPIEQT